MDYLITKILPNRPDHQVQVSFELDAHGWCALERSPEWAALEDLIHVLQKEHNHLPIQAKGEKLA